MKSVSSCNEAAEAAHNASGDFLRLIDGRLLSRLRPGPVCILNHENDSRRQVSIIPCDAYSLLNKVGRVLGDKRKPCPTVNSS